MYITWSAPVESCPSLSDGRGTCRRRLGPRAAPDHQIDSTSPKTLNPERHTLPELEDAASANPGVKI